MILRSVIALTMLAPAAAGAQDAVRPEPRAGTRGAELGVGVLDHATRKFFRDAPMPGTYYEGEEERGTVDLHFVYRLPPVASVLDARPNARLQVNTGGRTSFAAIGSEWRQYVLGGRLYGSIGIGLAVHDGYRFTPDPRRSGLSRDETLRRLRVEQRRTSFGSPVLFNPNAAIGVRVSDRWAVEAAWEHFSHKQLFSRQNPGIDNLGVRVVRMLGRRG